MLRSGALWQQESISFEKHELNSQYDVCIIGGGSVAISTDVSGLGTGVASALGFIVGTAGSFVVNGGALGTPSSGTLTNTTGLPISTGVSGLGTGVATALGTNIGSVGSVILNGGALGTPSSGTLTNATGLPISTGVSGLGTNVATFLATPSSANLASAVADETGTGALVFAGSPTFTGTANFAALSTSGNVTVGGGTTVTLFGQDVFIKNKDLILGYTTSITGDDASTDDTANHAGVAIASTVGSPLVSFSASGINTLPDTYKQLMWFHAGTLGFSTDVFAFNYGVAIGTTNMANGVRLADFLS